MRAVNLLPRDEPRQSFGHLRVVAVAGAGGFVAISLLLSALMVMAGSSVRDKQKALDVVSAQLAAVPPPPAAVDTSGQDKIEQEHSARVAALSSALNGRVAWDRVLRQVSLVLPEDVWLTTLSAQSPAAAGAAGAAAGARSFTISGATYSQAAVARFLSRLAVIPDLKNVELQSSARAEVGGGNVVQFSISADVKTPGAAS